MNRQIEIHWGSLGKVTATLLDDKNPEICDIFWNLLPFKTFQIHAAVSGYMMYCYTPLNNARHLNKVKYRVNYVDMKVGTICASGTGLLTTLYGEVTEDLMNQPIATVNEKDLGTLKQVGKAVWNSVYYTKEKIIVEYRKKS
jgi:hypothetical protein